MPAFDRMAAEAQVIGLGEATHGSREFGDLRLALVKRLVERNGYRLIALEDSVSRWRLLEPYVAGNTDVATPEAVRWGWIGRRTLPQLLDWVRRWNVRHPRDRVRIVGVDAQGNAPARNIFGRYLERAYGAPFLPRWKTTAVELAAADEQTPVFGDSTVNGEARKFMFEMLARLTVDRPVLEARYGQQSYAEAAAAARELIQFVDFNSGGDDPSNSRDWYMAASLLEQRSAHVPAAKAIYWGHNAHVSAAKTRWGPTGGVLRSALGCGYRGIATTFGKGAFVAQIPNDLEDRLAVTTLPAAAEESLENVLAAIGPGAHFVTWPCAAKAEPAPQWLAKPQPMRWVGGLYAPSSPASASYRPYSVLEAFDGIAFIPTVGAEAVPPDQPKIPARRFAEPIERK